MIFDYVFHGRIFVRKAEEQLAPINDKTVSFPSQSEHEAPTAGIHEDPDGLELLRKSKFVQEEALESFYSGATFAFEFPIWLENTSAIPRTRRIDERMQNIELRLSTHKYAIWSACGRHNEVAQTLTVIITDLAERKTRSQQLTILFHGLSGFYPWICTWKWFQAIKNLVIMKADLPVLEQDEMWPTSIDPCMRYRIYQKLLEEVFRKVLEPALGPNFDSKEVGRLAIEFRPKNNRQESSRDPQSKSTDHSHQEF